ncbi:MAG: hypothetical protein WC001_06875 [Desulfurivibrionaceae bacterium]
MALNPLGTVKTIVEAAGMGISYAYEDLVFLEHNSFLLQFTDHEVVIHLNSEADEATVHGDIERLRQVALEHTMQFTRGTHYILVPEGEDAIRLEFSG